MCTATTCNTGAACFTVKDGTTASTAAGTNVCNVLTAFTQPAVGDTGDEVGVMIWNKTATKKIPGIRIGRRVTAVTNCAQSQTKLASVGTEAAVAYQTTATTPVNCSSQTNEDFNESWLFTAPAVTDWTDVAKSGLVGTGAAADYTATGSRQKILPGTAANTSGTIITFTTNTPTGNATWGTAQTCDTKKWADATACRGIDLPWGSNGTWAMPDGKGTTAVTGRWFRWLSDAVTDKTAQFTVEKGDVLYMVLFEKWGAAPANNDSTSTNVIGNYKTSGTQTYGFSTAAHLGYAGYKCQPVSYNWGIATYTVAGASSMLIGASALIAGVAATLF